MTSPKEYKTIASREGRERGRRDGPRRARRFQKMNVTNVKTYSIVKEISSSNINDKRKGKKEGSVHHTGTRALNTLCLQPNSFPQATILVSFDVKVDTVSNTTPSVCLRLQTFVCQQAMMTLDGGSLQ